MSGSNEHPQGSWSSERDRDESTPTNSAFFTTPHSPSASATPRQPLSRVGSRNAGNWPDASPLHHNEGTSYFQQQQRYEQGRISPTLSRRMQHQYSTPIPGPPPPPSSYGGPGPRPTSQRRHSRSLQRSTSMSSSRPPRHRDTTLSEQDDDEDGEEAADLEERIGGRQRSRDGRRTPVPPRNDEDSSSTDDPEDEAARAIDAASETGSFVDPVTLKERQSLINVEHPFGLPIWKPALYKKSRTVTRNAEDALHSDPSAAPELHLLPGNVIWTLLFGWWLAIICFVSGAPLFLVGSGGKVYGKLIWGLGWYLFWPFGKYLEGVVEETEQHTGDEDEDDDEEPHTPAPGHEDLRTSVIQEDPLAEDQEDSYTSTLRPRRKSNATPGVPFSSHSTITPANANSHPSEGGGIPSERTPLMEPTQSVSQTTSAFTVRIRSYGSTPLATLSQEREKAESHRLSTLVYFLLFLSIIAPIMLLVTLICWAGVFTIPMAKLNWELLNYLFWHPLRIRFRAPPPPMVMPSPPSGSSEEDNAANGSSPPPFMAKPHRLRAGQVAPSGSPEATVLLCIYRAVGSQYYKYTVGGVNILFVNLIPVIFFVILDNFLLLKIKDHREERGQGVHWFLAFIASRALIFGLSLASVIPLSYFIGMAVASISAQSSIGMGAVINATFGSIIEIILYAIALTSGKGRLVEGSIVGSLLVGVLLMPGVSMIAGALRKKEQRFNAKSAGVTSTMLIMAIIGTLTPTLFYQTYGEFTLICDGCPTSPDASPWRCRKCFYEHPDPATDPFYQETVKSLMYLCASVLIFSYLIGLWFSLRTHASQIWQNPQSLMQQPDAAAANRMSLWTKLTPTDLGLPTTQHRGLNRQASSATITHSRSISGMRPARRDTMESGTGDVTPARPPSPLARRGVPQTPGAGAPPVTATKPDAVPKAVSATAPGLTPLVESVNLGISDATSVPPIQLPPTLTADDFTRAVAVATVSALRHQQNQLVAMRPRAGEVAANEAAGHGGHDAPSWSRAVSASVLLACTVLYAIIAEILVDVVDVVLEGSGIDEKFLGITLFALVPNTTEFMNAISFALNNNIALSMEIGSAYALQVCLLQIPAMVAFSAYNNPSLGSLANSFTLIFPRWDVIAIILSIFLLTYTYIEAKANYYRGSILCLSYIVLTAGFFFAPPRAADDAFHEFPLGSLADNNLPRVSTWSSLWTR